MWGGGFFSRELRGRSEYFQGDEREKGAFSKDLRVRSEHFHRS